MIRPLLLSASALTLMGAVAFPLSIVAGSATASAQTPANGETLFRQRCQTCHSVAVGGKAGVGPNLRGVVGRNAAATAFKYSPALQKSKVTWTKANLDRYLTAPTRMVPGTRMVISVTDAGQRAALVQYLSQTR
ncbi:c-type cytochrome [Sphingobium boeckii]|uniref:Cytochrome c n=1 Tax=Sphingobium boeckii TaxID=1082345 RepID=A0A7W9AIC8_9SPHN|nr:c-type cytochrome [Sphingobium boeckii]MBB5685966.1 cytochrome c [Sphingobium boeckii]